MSSTGLSGHSGWHTSQSVSWYGPGFYNNRTACGQKYVKDTKKHRGLIGVANRTLPCGTMVTFKWNGHYHTFPVVDRGPYGVAGRDFDWTNGAARRMGGYFTHYNVKWRICHVGDPCHSRE